MRTLYLDCFAGASGDMFIGALLDCGLDFDLLKRALSCLGVSGYELSLQRMDQSGISAAKFDVHLHEEAPAHHHSHAHEHSLTHGHDHHREHNEHTGHHGHDHAHRPLSEIKRLIEASTLSAQVK